MSPLPKHKGLRKYYDTGQPSKIKAEHVAKIRLILTRLDAISAPEMMNVPGYRFHRLTGNMKDFYSVRVDKNYRIVFRFHEGDVHDVDYVDYH